MIPQATPLYAVGEGDTHIDLLLVVAWTPTSDHDALPVMLDLHSAVGMARTMTGEHRHVEFYDDRELAGVAYEAHVTKLRQLARRRAGAEPDAPCSAGGGMSR